jgi:hypothetical protein
LIFPVFFDPEQSLPAVTDVRQLMKSAWKLSHICRSGTVKSVLLTLDFIKKFQDGMRR